MIHKWCSRRQLLQRMSAWRSHRSKWPIPAGPTRTRCRVLRVSCAALANARCKREQCRSYSIAPEQASRVGGGGSGTGRAGEPSRPFVTAATGTACIRLSCCPFCGTRSPRVFRWTRAMVFAFREWRVHRSHPDHFLVDDNPATIEKADSGTCIEDAQIFMSIAEDPSLANELMRGCASVNGAPAVHSDLPWERVQETAKPGHRPGS